MSIIIKQLSKSEIDDNNINNWPIWTCDISEFDWEYTDKESCLLLEGEVEVTTDTGVFKFKAGDFVVFSRGLKCRWKVFQPVKKHYNFG